MTKKILIGLALVAAGVYQWTPAKHACLQMCRERFDLVLVDTSPVLAVADATFVANLAGSTLLVLRADTTLPDQVDSG